MYVRPSAAEWWWPVSSLLQRCEGCICMHAAVCLGSLLFRLPLLLFFEGRVVGRGGRVTF